MSFFLPQCIAKLAERSFNKDGQMLRSSARSPSTASLFHRPGGSISLDRLDLFALVKNSTDGSISLDHLDPLALVKSRAQEGGQDRHFFRLSWPATFNTAAERSSVTSCILIDEGQTKPIVSVP